MEIQMDRDSTTNLQAGASWEQDYDTCLKKGESMVLEQEEELRIIWEWPV